MPKSRPEWARKTTSCPATGNSISPPQWSPNTILGFFQQATHTVLGSHGVATNPCSELARSGQGQSWGQSCPSSVQRANFRQARRRCPCLGAMPLTAGAGCLSAAVGRAREFQMGWADRCQHDAKPVLLTWHRVPASLFFFFFDHQAMTLCTGSPLGVGSVCSNFSFCRRVLRMCYGLFTALPLFSTSWRAMCLSMSLWAEEIQQGSKQKFSAAEMLFE